MSSNNRIDSTALFHILNGAYYTTVSVPMSELNFDRAMFIGRSVEFDFSDDSIEGSIIIGADGSTIDDFKVVSKSEKPPVMHEQDINSDTVSAITKRYPISEQLNVLMRSLKVIAKELDISIHEDGPLEELGEMLNYIDTCVQVGNATKEHFSKGTEMEYITDEQLTKQIEEEIASLPENQRPIMPPSRGRVFKTDL